MTTIKNILPNTPLDWQAQKAVEKAQYQKKMIEKMKGSPYELEMKFMAGQEITQEDVNNAEKLKGMRYQNRDLMPEPYLRFSDLYHELTKQELTKRVVTDWMMTFESWKQEKLTEDDIRAAFNKSNDINSGFPVGRPGALTTTALAMKTKDSAAPMMKVNTKAIEGTKQMLEEQVKDMVFVPRPASVPRPVFKKEDRS